MINKIHPAGILCDYDQLQTCEEFEFNSKGTLLKKKTQQFLFYMLCFKYRNYDVHKLGVISPVLSKLSSHTEEFLPMWKILPPVL